MQILLDTGILGQLCHPRRRQNRPVTNWLLEILEKHGEYVRVFVPEIADYELRRKLYRSRSSLTHFTLTRSASEERT